MLIEKLKWHCSLVFQIMITEQMIEEQLRSPTRLQQQMTGEMKSANLKNKEN